MAEVSASNRRRCRRISPGSPARAAVIASVAAAGQPVQPDSEECPVPRMVAIDADGGQRGGLGFGEHGAGRLGDLDDDPAREGHSRLALGQHPQAGQGSKTTRLMVLDLVGDGHGSWEPFTGVMDLISRQPLAARLGTKVPACTYHAAW